jgi:hypothetical protein
MYKEVLRSIDGVEVFPVISLLLFFAFFVGVVVWSIGLDRQRVSELARLPLDGDPERPEEGDGHE